MHILAVCLSPKLAAKMPEAKKYASNEAFQAAQAASPQAAPPPATPPPKSPPKGPKAPPKPKDVDLTGDGGVMKLVLKAGKGAKPTKGQRCEIKYEGKLEDGTVVMKVGDEEGPGDYSIGRTFHERDMPDPFSRKTEAEKKADKEAKLQLERENIQPLCGLHAALLEMKIEAHWEVVIEADLAYGEAGRPAMHGFPEVPPNSKLICDIEFHGFTPVTRSTRTTRPS